MHDASSKKLRDLGVLAAFVVLSVAMTWPLARQLDTHVVSTKWHYDSMVNIHVLGSRMHFVLGKSAALRSIYDNYFCAPTPYSITNNEAHFGLVLLYAPFFLITDNPLLAYNLLLLLCMSLSGFFTYLLVRELSGSARAGVLSGIAFAFCPYIFFELGRIQLVAAQWLPLFALFLHRAGKTSRTRDLLGLGLTFAMQIGCCLYYAMFMLVYGLFVGSFLIVKNRLWSRRFALQLGLAGVLVALLVAPQVYPYFRARQDFSQVRSQALTQRYAGKAQDLASVYTGNKTLIKMRNSAPGPEEPIAFPGFTLLLLALIGVLLPLVRTIRSAAPGARRELLIGTAVLGVLAPVLAVGGTFMAHSFLAGVIVFVAALAWWRAKGTPLLPPVTYVYFLLLLLGLSLYLGPTPFQEDGTDVRGTYYYLYRYVPGFDGIRYVSRFAVLNMLSLAVLGGFGTTLLLRSLARRAQWLVFGVLLAAMLFELRNAPVTLAKLPILRDLPAYQWLAQHPGPEPIASMPAYTMGYYGARNDYFALFHRRRTIDGKSSWMPPVTYAYIYETRRFPRESGARLLQTLGAKYLVLHGDELGTRLPGILRWLDARPRAFQKRFNHKRTYVYEVLKSTDPSVTLLRTPEVPSGSERVPSRELEAHSNTADQVAHLSVDGDAKSHWETARYQVPGTWYEVTLKSPRMLTAIELGNYSDAFEAPAAFRISVTAPDGASQVVFTRPQLRYYYDQVFHPRSFVFRVALPKPTLAKAVKIELLDGVASRRWQIRETTLWATRAP